MRPLLSCGTVRFRRLLASTLIVFTGVAAFDKLGKGLEPGPHFLAGFIVFLVRDLIRRLSTSRHPSLAAGALAAVAAMVAAGLFEYNFGDSEFLMLFLVLITLPYAADRAADDLDAR